MNASDPFDLKKYLNSGMGDILGIKKTETIEESFAKIAENSRVKVLEEENARLKAENERLRETIIRCPKCGTKLRLPKPKE
jgi:uncharacterized protein with PIN domain